jgi:hypothetical protein
MWAPPISVYGSTQTRPPPPPPPVNRSPSPPPPPPPMLDDDVYARRAAPAHVASGDDAYARRQAMSQTDQGRAPPPFLQAPQPRKEPMSGDDAFAHRAALSQAQAHTSYTPSPQPPFRPPPITANMPPFPPSHAFPPPPSSFTQPMPPFLPNTMSQAGPSNPIPAPLSSDHGIPGFSSSSKATPTPSVADVSAEPVAEPAPPSSEDFAKMLEERRKAAASIAERLKNLGPAAPVHAPIPEPEE